MRISFVLPGLGDSGGIRVVKEYTELFNEMGIDTCIYCPILADNLHRYPYGTVNLLHRIYCTLKTLAGMDKKQKYVRWIPYVAGRYIREADYVIATMWATAYKVKELPDRCGEKWYFIQGYEIWDNEELGKGSYNLPLKKLVISSWINTQLKENLGIGPFPIVFNGVNAKFLREKVEDKQNKKLSILMVNHEDSGKGVDTGLEVFAKVRERYPEIRFSMFGFCKGSNLPDYVEYYRNPDENTLIKLYSQSDIFLFPSLGEGWGLPPLEAMAGGCAVAAANTGFVRDVGTDRENVMISETGDVQGMFDNVAELVENADLRERLVRNGYALVKRLDWRASAESFINVLTQQEDRNRQV
jgi:hypothetical protein